MFKFVFATYSFTSIILFENSKKETKLYTNNLYITLLIINMLMEMAFGKYEVQYSRLKSVEFLFLSVQYAPYESTVLYLVFSGTEG